MKALTLAITLGISLIAIVILANEADNLKIENSLLKANLDIINATLTEKMVVMMSENSYLKANLTDVIIENKMLEEERNYAVLNQKVAVLPKRINIELGKYNLKFDDKCRIGNDCVGWTFRNRDINIVDNRSIDEIIVTCNHEWLHNQIKVLDSQFEEQVTEQLDDKVIIPECEALRSELEG